MPDASQAFSLKLVRRNGVPVTAPPVVLSPEGLTLGSDEAPGIFHLDAGLFVAPRHAHIGWQGGAWELSACDARVVCVLNGQKLRPDSAQVLTLGDVIEVGFAALEVEHAPVGEHPSPWQEDIPLTHAAFAPVASAFNALLPEQAGLPEILESDCDTQDDDLLTILSMPAPLTVPEPLASVSNPSESLVDLLIQDLGSDAGQMMHGREHPLLEDFDTFVAPMPDSPESGAARQPDTGDILENLARESERSVQGEESDTSFAVFSALAQGSDPSSDCAAEDPLALLALSSEASLADILEGPLHIDDVLAGLDTAETPPLLETAPCQPDPLLLLAGRAAKMPSLRLTDILHQDHHNLTMGTPYHQGGATPASPNTAADSPVRRPEEA